MDTGTGEKVDLRALGKELQEARKRRGLTQEDAANILEVARTTITAIEKGERRIREPELIKLAYAYGCQLNDLVRRRPRVEPFQVQFRGPYQRSEEDKRQILPYIEELEELCRSYLELEELAGAPLARKYPPEYPVKGLRAEQAAEGVALEERNRLGLGDGPVPILRDILEQDVGLRIFYLPLPAKFAAMYFYNEQLGGCMAINCQHPEERRRWSMAHDYDHFLVDRYRPEILVEEGYQRVPESERRADYFAMHFLMPTSGLTRRFNDIHRTRGKVTPADLCVLARYYGVSFEALARRLETIRLLPTGTWDRLREGGFRVREAQQQLGLNPIPARDEKLPLRYQYLAVDVFDRGLITEGQLARFLRVDRLDARRITEVLRQQQASGAEGIGLAVDLMEIRGLPTLGRADGSAS